MFTSSAPQAPPWWRWAHATVGVSLAGLLAVGLSHLLVEGSRLAWPLLFAVLVLAAGGLYWKIGKVDASLGRGRILLGIQAYSIAAAGLGLLTTLHPMFAGLVVAFPLVSARLRYPSAGAPWVFASALTGLVLFSTPIPFLGAFALVTMALVVAGLTIRSTPARIHTAYVPEDSLKLHRPAFLLEADPALHEKQNEASTTDTLHQLVSTARAAARGRFAGIFWLDSAHTHVSAAIVETSLEVELHGAPLPCAQVFSDVTWSETSSTQLTLDHAPAWYADAPVDDAQLLVAQIVDDGIALGLLIVERAAAHGVYRHADVVVAEHCAKLVARQLRQERQAIAARRTSHELRLVARAAELLSDTLHEREVYRLGEELYRELLGEVEVAFVQKNDDEVLQFTYLSMSWDTHTAGDVLPATPSLISVAIQRRHTLPYRPEGEHDDPPLFGDVRTKLAMDQHLVLPLVSGREAHSAVVLRVPDAAALRPAVRDRLQLVSTQLAAALSIARSYESMVVRATTDGMTRLLNHVTFRDQSAQAVERARRNKHPLSVLLLDIDHFKAVNDTYGHGVGDDVIRRVADAIRAQVRRVDVAARYGGEEFAIVLENTGEEGALLFAERLRTAIEGQRFTSDQGDFGVTVSVGVAVYPAHGQRAEQLTENADAALYVSKRAGRNRVTIWSEKGSAAAQVA